MKVVARRLQGFAHEIDVDDGAHSFVVDEPPAIEGGTDAGPSPGRLLAASLATCTAVTMEMYAERKGWDLNRVEVEVNASYDDHIPKAYEVTVRLPAELSEEQRERLLVVAKKCPIHRLLSGERPAEITDRAELLP